MVIQAFLWIIIHISYGFAISKLIQHLTSFVFHLKAVYERYYGSQTAFVTPKGCNNGGITNG